MVSDSPYLVGFCFSLSLEKSDAAFQEISGISKEWDLEEVRGGGENNFKYRLPTVCKFQNLVLKRGIVNKTSPLTNWCKKILDGGLAQPIKPKDVTVSVLDSKGKACRSWHFTKAYPVKWTVSDLKSQENSLLIESVELAYHYYTTVPV